jgi:hypothetical protein
VNRRAYFAFRGKQGSNAACRPSRQGAILQCMDAQALASLYATIRNLFPPGAKRERWLAWALQLGINAGGAGAKARVERASPRGKRMIASGSQ